MSSQAEEIDNVETCLADFPFNAIAQMDQGVARFDFSYRSLDYEAEVSQNNGGPAKLHLSSKIGEIPFTVQGPQLRTNILAILQAAKYGEMAKFQIDQRQEILLHTSYELKSGASAADILSQIIMIVSSARPYIELLHTLMPPAQD